MRAALVRVTVAKSGDWPLRILARLATTLGVPAGQLLVRLTPTRQTTASGRPLAPTSHLVDDTDATLGVTSAVADSLLIVIPV